MASMALKVTTAFFDSKGLKYQVLDEEKGVLRVGFGMDNRDPMGILIIFSPDDTVASFRSTVAKAPEDKKAKMFEVCNSLNAHYKWIKFYFDVNDCTIMAEDDAVIDLASCGDEVFRCCLQLVHIVDEAYPEIMKGIFM